MRSLIAGVLVANSAPHLASAAAGRWHLTPLAGRNSGLAVNAVWGTLSLVGGLLLRGLDGCFRAMAESQLGGSLNRLAYSRLKLSGPTVRNACMGCQSASSYNDPTLRHRDRGLGGYPSSSV
jgi:hypothetical protein